jgi:hypothetical protein
MQEEEEEQLEEENVKLEMVCLVMRLQLIVDLLMKKM